MSEELSDLPQIEVKDYMKDEFSKNGSTNRTNSESDSENENNLKPFQNELKDKPDILNFIIRQSKRIKKLEKKIKKLKSHLKKLKPKSEVKCKNNSTQTPTEVTEEVKTEDCPKSITEEIKEAAENAMHTTGFVYEPTSGMYYDYNTGYYYNAELGLYYDGNRGTYLIYNSETQTYDFHSQVPRPEETGAKRKKPHREQDGKRAKKSKEPDQNLEEGECSESEKDTSSDVSESTDDDFIEISKSWPPCMRIILKETTIEKLKIGSLFIVTCDGGKIGREGEKSVIIPDINVSKNHAEIIFNKEEGQYMITDLGSQNGTILNGKRISAPKKISEPHGIVHGSVLQFGTTKLLCHIHEGQKTCGHCEPGLIQIEKPPQIDLTARKTQHKKELRRLKKKFGLESSDLTGNLAEGYSDRAEERRKTVGSLNENEKTQVASLHESIASDNKGFKMLSKMGWSEGQSLGKDGTGLTEPVPLVSNEGKSGLGTSCDSTVTLSSDVSSERKSTVWKKAQLRFQKVKDVSLDAFKDESDPET